MATAKNLKATIRKLSKRITVSRRKEKSTRNKLRKALSKMKKLNRTFERKLDQKAKESKTKVSAAQSALYIKLANSIRKKAKKSRKAGKAKHTASPRKRGGRRRKMRRR